MSARETCLISKPVRGIDPRRTVAFSILELIVSIGILAMMLTLVAQLSFWSMRERLRTGAHQAALELADNTLEAARATPWEDLTPEWATKRTLPTELEPLLPSGQLLAKVEPEMSRPHTKRVAVEVRWQRDPDTPGQTVKLVGLFATRRITGKAAP